jgi:outer membrane autotransporter protein
MKDADKFNATSRRFLACTIAAALFAPGVSLAVTGQQLADGTELSLLPGEYDTSAVGLATLYALNGGSITAGSGVLVNTTGLSAYGIWASGAGSSVAFNGGSIATTGQNGHGVFTFGGGTVTFGADPGGVGTTLSTSNMGAYGLRNFDTASSINATNLTISTTGMNAHGAYNSGVMNLTDSSISTTADGSYGIYTDGGGQTSLTNVTINTQGRGAHGAAFDGQTGATSGVITGSTISTSGIQANGVMVTMGANVSVADTNVRTSGDSAYGVVLDKPGSAVSLDTVAVNTSGNASYVLWLVSANAVVSAENFAFQTTGSASTAVNNRSADVVLTDGNITTTGPTSHALYASLEYGNNAAINATNVQVLTEGANSVGAWGRLGAGISLTDSSITTLGGGALGVNIEPMSTASLVNTSVQTSGTGSHGVYSAGNVTIQNGTVATLGQQAYGVAVATTNPASPGQLSLDNVKVTTEGVNAYAAAVGAGGGTLNVNNSMLSSKQAAVFGIISSGDATTNIQLTNGTQVASDTGVLMNVVNPSNQVTLTMDQNVAAQGDIVFDPSLTSAGATPAPNVNVALSNASQWSGAVQGAVNELSLDSGSLWTVTGNSSVEQLALNDSNIQFTSPASGGYKTLTVNGDFSGSGGIVGMNTLLNEGGPLSNQQTDRLLITGNVTTTGTTLLDVTPQGTGASAPVDNGGVVGAGDGISLVQVGGTSRADAFALRYGYVAVGPYQYKLYAFGPGQTDPAQNVLPSGELNWDYRLAPKYVEGPGDGGNPGEPGDGGRDDGKPDPEGGGKPVDPPVINPPVQDLVAQLPSYIVAPTALLTYGDTLIDTLHQRLGEIRQPGAADPRGGELFVRYIGSQQRYASNQRTYGYDFDQQINAVQLGGSLISLTSDASSLRLGWALDKGVTRVTPRVYNSEDSSFSRYDAHGASAWMTWQQENGFYVDAVVGGERYQGTVNTAVRGAVANIRAGGWTASVETGYPFAVGGGWWVEPQLQVKHRTLSIDPFQDVDNINTQIQVGGLTSTRAGVRFAKTDNPQFSPYGRLDFIHASGGSSKTTASNPAWGELGTGTFEGGRLGNTVRVGAGANSRLTPYLSLHGEADYLHATSDYGTRGWQANVGVRFEF